MLFIARKLKGARGLLALSALASTASAASPQSVYVDLTPDPGGATPQSGYVAASGIPGVWNNFVLSIAPQQPHTYTSGPLVDITAHPTAVTLEIYVYSLLGSTQEAFTNPLTGATGDHAALLEDGISIWGAGSIIFGIHGAEPGEYDLYVYSIRESPSSSTNIGSVNISGDFSQGFVELRTHARLIDVSPFPINGAISVTLDSSPVSTFNGLQLVKRGGGVIGSPFCDALPNSTGGAGGIFAVGTNETTDNNLRLLATDLPPGQFGIFAASPIFGVPTPVQAGQLCLSGPIGRFGLPSQVFQAGPTGIAEFEVDLTAFPTPTALITVSPGETWHFQGWHRDVVQGSLTSNFTNGVSVQFQ